MRPQKNSLTPHEVKLVRSLTLHGIQEKIIAERLGRPRGAVYRARKRLGIQGTRPGVPGQILTSAQRRAILKLFEKGHGYQFVARKLGFREHAVRLLAESVGHHGRRLPRHELSLRQLANLKEDILQRHDRAFPLSHKYGTSYDFMLAFCKQVLGCARLTTGRPRLPLESPFPQRWPKPFKKNG